jgi:hypothetical protein
MKQRNVEFMKMCNAADELKDDLGAGPWSFDEMELYVSTKGFNRCHLENLLFNMQTLLGQTYPEINTGRKLLLCFIMKEQYGKTWNGYMWIQE